MPFIRHSYFFLMKYTSIRVVEKKEWLALNLGGESVSSGSKIEHVAAGLQQRVE
jgi:hypothetical protein